MPKFTSSQEWLEQSALLLKAYPSTTKVTTKYNLPNPSKPVKSRKRKAPADEDDTAKADSETQPRIATLEVRTFDPVSGVVLKYQTTKGWEVGRLMVSLGRLGRHMAALPEVAEDVAMLDAKEEVASGTHTPLPETATDKSKLAAPENKGGQAGGGGGKKKKKGKR